MEPTTVIKVKNDTKTMLQEMKIVERESFDEVIKRLILSTEGDEGSLRKATEKMIFQRLESKRKGKVVSIDEILERMRLEKKKVNR